ncbi:MAG: hypothetical protein HQK51_16415 [Oligoflexia bacterium]|nr:hypothetical protein [Oligoflexia bacterium]
MMIKNTNKITKTISGEFFATLEEGDNGLLCLTSDINNLKFLNTNTTNANREEQPLDLPELRKGYIDFIQYTCDAQTLQMRRSDVNTKILFKRIFH